MPYRKETVGLKRIISSIIAFAYIVTNVVMGQAAETNYWQERRRRGSQPLASTDNQSLWAGYPGPNTVFPGAIGRSLPSHPRWIRGDLFESLPLSLGTVRKAVTGPKGAPVVFHIKDVHQNDDAQRGIAGAIRALGPSAGVIALEGAAGPIDLSRWRASPDKEALRWAADYLLEHNDISGAVYGVLESTGSPPPLLGVDDPVHYAANVRAYRQASAQRAARKSQWSRAREVLSQEKAKVYHSALKTLDEQVAGHCDQKVTFSGYVHAIVKANPVAARKKTRISALLTALDLEDHLDFAEVERQRVRLVEKLVAVVDKKGADRLTRHALAYRIGDIGYAEFYRGLQALCRDSGVALSGFPAMDRYIQYVSLADGIDVPELLRQVTDQERDAYALLARSPEEKALVARDRQNRLTGKLLDFSLTPEEWADYRPTPELADFENFYREAEARNETMAHGILQAMKARKSSFGVLVTGGFHSAGMERIFKKAGVTVVGFTPRIEKLDGSPDYLSVFTREKTPLENLFEGDKLFLAQPPVRESVVKVLGPALVVLAAALLGAGGQLFEPAAAYSAMGGLGILAMARSRGGAAATVTLPEKGDLLLEATAGPGGFREVRQSRKTGVGGLGSRLKAFLAGLSLAAALGSVSPPVPAAVGPSPAASAAQAEASDPSAELRERLSRPRADPVKLAQSFRPRIPMETWRAIFKGDKDDGMKRVAGVVLALAGQEADVRLLLDSGKIIEFDDETRPVYSTYFTAHNAYSRVQEDVRTKKTSSERVDALRRLLTLKEADINFDLLKTTEEAVLRSLTKGNEEEKAAAIDVVGRFGFDDDFRILSAYVDDRLPMVKMAARNAVLNRSLSSTADFIVPLAKKHFLGSAEDQIFAIQLLRYKRSEASLIEPFLKSGHPLVRDEARSTLRYYMPEWRVIDPDLVPYVLVWEAQGEKQWRAVAALGPKALPALLAYFEEKLHAPPTYLDRSSKARKTLTDLLVEHPEGIPQATPVLKRLLNESLSDESLSLDIFDLVHDRLTPEEKGAALKTIEKIINNPNHPDRPRAMKSMKILGGADAEDFFKAQMLKTFTFEYFDLGRHRLTSSEKKTVLARLETILLSKELEIRTRAMESVEKIGGEEAAAFARDLLTDYNIRNSVRPENVLLREAYPMCLRILARTGSPEDLKVLREFQRDAWFEKRQDPQGEWLTRFQEAEKGLTREERARLWGPPIEPGIFAMASRHITGLVWGGYGVLGLVALYVLPLMPWVLKIWLKKPPLPYSIKIFPANRNPVFIEKPIVTVFAIVIYHLGVLFLSVYANASFLAAFNIQLFTFFIPLIVLGITFIIFKVTGGSREEQKQFLKDYKQFLEYIALPYLYLKESWQYRSSDSPDPFHYFYHRYSTPSLWSKELSETLGGAWWPIHSADGDILDLALNSPEHAKLFTNFFNARLAIKDFFPIIAQHLQDDALREKLSGFLVGPEDREWLTLIIADTPYRDFFLQAADAARPGDADDLRQALRRLAKDPDRMSEAHYFVKAINDLRPGPGNFKLLNTLLALGPDALPTFHQVLLRSKSIYPGGSFPAAFTTELETAVNILVDLDPEHPPVVDFLTPFMDDWVMADPRPPKIVNPLEWLSFRLGESIEQAQAGHHFSDPTSPIIRLDEFLYAHRDKAEMVEFAYLPEEARARIRGPLLEQGIRGLTTANYREEPYATALYVLMRRKGWAWDFSYDRYCSVLQGTTVDVAVSDLVETAVKFLGNEGLSNDEKQRISAVSESLHRTLLEALPLDGPSAIGIRDLVRFNEDFSDRYHRLKNPSDAVSLFTITAHTVYGRLIRHPGDRERFVEALQRVFNSQEAGSFLRLAARGTQGQDWITSLMDFGDYDDFGGSPPGDVPHAESRMRSLVDRAYQSGRSLLLRLDQDNPVYWERVLDRLKKEGAVVLPVAMSRFTGKKDLFGMYVAQTPLPAEEVDDVVARADEAELSAALQTILEIPQEELALHWQDWLGGFKDDPDIKEAVAAYLKDPENWRENLAWEEGLLERSAKAAAARKHRVVLVFDNIEACPDRVRTLFNAVLSKKYVRSRDGYPVLMPPELQVVFTLPTDAEIVDASFMNRSLEHTPPAADESDLETLLTTQDIGLPAALAKALLKRKEEFEKGHWENPPSLRTHDWVEIARRTVGASQADLASPEAEEVLNREMAAYLWLQLGTHEDRQRFSESFGAAEPSRRYADGVLYLDGVGIEVSEDYKRYFAAHPEASLETALYDLEKRYVLGGLELRLLAQMVRAHRGFASPFIQFEGPSGEGKTRLGHVFAHLSGLKVNEITVNQDTGVGDLRGSMVRSRAGRHRLLDSSYIDQVRRPGHVFIYNEPNTNHENGAFHWLLPEIAGRSRKLLPEFPAGDRGLPYSTAIDRHNLWLCSVNDAATAGREPLPARTAAHLTRFQVVQDPRALPALVQSVFTRDPALSVHGDFVSPLVECHNALSAAAHDGIFSSSQGVTRRELFRAVARFKRYLAEGRDAPRAFAMALEDVYVSMWRTEEDKTRALHLLASHASGRFSADAPLDPARSLNAALDEDAPVMVLTNETTAARAVESAILGAHPAAVLHAMPESYLHRRDSFIGGNTPATGGDRRWNALVPFREALGFFTDAVEKTRLDPSQDHLHYLLLLNHTHLGPGVAPFLNEYLQGSPLRAVDRVLTPALARDLLSKPELAAAWGRLRCEYQGDALPEDRKQLTEDQILSFARWFYGAVPANLRLVATGDARDPLWLGEPEMDRFLAVNLSEPYDEAWIKKYLSINAGPQLADHLQQITSLALDVFKAAPPNRLGRADLDAYLAELRDEISPSGLDRGTVEKVAYYALGIGLPEDKQNDLAWKPPEMPDPENRLGYKEQSDGIYLEVDGVRMKTRFRSAEEIPPPSTFRASTEAQTRTLAALLIGVKNGRSLDAEGYPGGGKSVVFEELGRRLGLSTYKTSMYADVDVGDFLGRLTRQGRDIFLTCQKNPAGRYLLSFLRAYEEGGVMLLDEGAIGVNGQEVIAYLVLLAQQDEIDLGTFHPGLVGQVIRRAGGPKAAEKPPFILGIAQNPATTTKDRENLLPSTSAAVQKVWVSSALSRADALRLIRFYTADEPFPELAVEALADIHRRLCDVHPQKRDLSPRQLINMALALKEARQTGRDLNQAFCQGLMLNYMAGLTEEEFDAVRQEIPETLRSPFARLMADWNNPFPSPVTLPAGQVRLDDDLPVLNRVQWTLDAKLKTNGHTALLEEDGADAMDALRRYCLGKGWALDVLWCHPQIMARMNILSTVLPRFQSSFDRYGVKMEDVSGEFFHAMNFLARHMVKEGEAEKPGDHPVTVLFFAGMDAVPERQRVLLNEILTVRRIELADGVYVLPPWIKIVVSMPEDHAFSSAFVNRFDQPIRVKALSDPADLAVALPRRFPLVSRDEAVWAAQVANTVYDMETRGHFDLHYGFTPADAFKLALQIQMEKQADLERGRLHGEPAYYVLKAVALTYGVDPTDAERLQDSLSVFLMEKVFRSPFMTTEMARYGAWARAEIDRELSTVELEVVSRSMELASFQRGQSVVLENGVLVRRLERGWEVRTPANEYRVLNEDLEGEGKVLSRCPYPAVLDGEVVENAPLLRLRRGDNVLVLDFSIDKTIGGVELARDDAMRRRSLPEEEVAPGQWAQFTPDLRRHAAAVLRHWRPVQDATGFVHRPRVTLRNGESGTVKSILVEALGAIWGVPVHTVDVSGDFRVADATVGLRLDKGKFLLTVKEALARVGRVNGRTIAVPSGATASRTIVCFDEGNTSPDLLNALQPILRGEREFTLYYAGEAVRVELFDGAIVDVAFNPSERYAGRHPFSTHTAAAGEKTWAPNPLARIQDPRDPTVSRILAELHRRGINRLEERAATRPLVATAGHWDLPPGLVGVKTARDFPAPAVSAFGSLTAGAGPDIVSGTGPGVAAGLPEEEAAEFDIIDVTVDMEALENTARSFTIDQGALFFARRILADYVKALPLGTVPDPVHEAVKKAAGIMGEDVAASVDALTNAYAHPSEVSRSAVDDALLYLRRALAKRDVFLYFVWGPRADEDISHMLISAEQILDRHTLDGEKLERLGYTPARLGFDTFEGKTLEAVVVAGEAYPGNKDDKRAYFEGEFAVVFDPSARESPSGTSRAVRLAWSGYHELGHMINSLVVKASGVPVPEDLTWPELADLINPVLRERGERLIPRNIELDAMLLPLVLGEDPRDYILQRLLPFLEERGDPRDTYCQAVKGIMNGLFNLKNAQKCAFLRRVPSKESLGSLANSEFPGQAKL